LGFPSGSDSEESAYNAGDSVRSLGQEDPPLEKQSTPLFLHGETLGQRSLVSYSP